MKPEINLDFASAEVRTLQQVHKSTGGLIAFIASSSDFTRATAYAMKGEPVVQPKPPNQAYGPVKAGKKGKARRW